jgi:hypothetical protein
VEPFRGATKVERGGDGLKVAEVSKVHEEGSLGQYQERPQLVPSQFNDGSPILAPRPRRSNAIGLIGPVDLDQPREFLLL